VVEDDDDRSESCESDISCFSQISSIEPQSEPELQQFCQLSSLNSEECSSATAIDASIKKHKQTKTKRRQSDQRQRYGNVGVQSLYHGIFTTFQCHNAYSYNSDKKVLIISLLINRKLVRTPPTMSKNAEVSSWWRGSSKSYSSSLHSTSR
jgi:hypothetical protein